MFVVYTLRTPDRSFAFEARQLTILDRDLSGGRKRVEVLVPGPVTPVIDGEAVKPAPGMDRTFGRLRLEFEGLLIEAASGGRLKTNAGGLVINLGEESIR